MSQAPGPPELELPGRERLCPIDKLARPRHDGPTWYREVLAMGRIQTEPDLVTTWAVGILHASGSQVHDLVRQALVAIFAEAVAPSPRDPLLQAEVWIPGLKAPALHGTVCLTGAGVKAADVARVRAQLEARGLTVETSLEYVGELPPGHGPLRYQRPRARDLHQAAAAAIGRRGWAVDLASLTAEP